MFIVFGVSFLHSPTYYSEMDTSDELMNGVSVVNKFNDLLLVNNGVNNKRIYAF